MAIEREVDLKVKVSGEEQLGELSNSLDDVSDSSSKAVSSLDDMPGSAGAAVKGVKSLTTAFKALLANPIGIAITLIVGALTGLYKVFERTAGGGDTLAKVFDGIGAAIGPVLDSLGRFADGLVSILSGDFKEGFDKMKGSFDGIGASIKEAYINAGLLVDLRRELQEMNRELIVGESELKAQMDEQRSILDDTDKSIQTRIAANNKLNELNKELLKSRQAYINKQLEEIEIQKEQAGLADKELQEVLDREATLIASKNDANAEKLRIDKEYVVKRNELLNQETANEQARLKAEEEYLKERNQLLAKYESERVDTISISKEKEVTIIQSADVTARQNQKVRDEIEAERNEKLAQARIAMASNTINTIGNLAAAFAGESEKSQRKAFAVQKAAGIAAATIQTWQAAQSAYASQLIPGDPTSPIRAAIAAGVAVAGGLANVAKIAKSKFQTSSGAPSGSSGFNGGGFGAQQTAPNFNVVGAGGQNQIAQLLAGQPPQKAYVVASEVSTQQALDRNILKSATL